MARLFTGDCWDGPIHGKACDACGSADKSVMELCRYVKSEKVESLGKFQCTDCHAAEYHRYQAERKAQLAAMERCEVPGCKRRGTWQTVGNTLLCGTHLKKAKAGHQRNMADLGSLAFLGMFDPAAQPNREQILKLAQD